MRRVDFRVYVIVDVAFGRGRSHEEVAAAVLEGGATVLQLREKVLPTRGLIEVAGRVKALTTQAGVPLIINDRVDVALAIQADGVHLGPDDLPVAIARCILGPDSLIGFSAGTVEEAVAAERDGADYLGVGSVFGTTSKPDAGPPIGLEGLRKIVQAVRVPVVAVGGITHLNAAAAMGAGASGVVALSTVVAADNTAMATRRLAEVVRASQR